MSKLDQLKSLGDAKRASRKSSDGGAERSTSQNGTSGPSRSVRQLPGKSRVREEVVSARNATPAGVLPGPSGTKLKRGRPKIEGKRPWELAGMSKRTWYRREQESKK